MPRYFLEVAYKGTNYSGFQVQKNANTIQAEIESALHILQKETVSLTGSSRTDAGVHALQNFFHFDTDVPLRLGQEPGREGQLLYKMNAILPVDIVVKKIIAMGPDAHCRFDAVSREYKYFIYQQKDPFVQDRAFYFPYKLNIELIREGADLIRKCRDFTSFSKKRTQARTFICDVAACGWEWENGCLVFNIKANRFLRGMVRGLVATLLRLGRGKITLSEFQTIIEGKEAGRANFAAPSQGLFLVRVTYPEGYFQEG